MAALFLSSPTVTGTQSRSESERLQPTAPAEFTDDLCKACPTSGEHIQACYRDMTEALIEYHVHGDFLAAASYTTAHNKWKQAVLDSIKGDAE
jgi:hypothetical protein